MMGRGFNPGSNLGVLQALQQKGNAYQDLGNIIGGTITRRKQRQEADALREQQELKRQQMLDEGQQIMGGGTPQQIADFMMKYPEAAKGFGEAWKFKNADTRRRNTEATVNALKSLDAGDVQGALRGLRQHAEYVKEAGGRPTEVLGTMALLANPETVERGAQSLELQLAADMASSGAKGLSDYLQFRAGPQEEQITPYQREKLDIEKAKEERLSRAAGEMTPYQKERIKVQREGLEARERESKLRERQLKMQEVRDKLAVAKDKREAKLTEKQLAQMERQMFNQNKKELLAQKQREVTLTADNATNQTAIDDINFILDPANKSTFKNLFGATLLPFSWAIPGTETYDMDNKVEGIKAAIGMAMMGKLKGQGSVSDAERAALQKASTALSTDMSETQAKAELERLRDVFQSLMIKGSAVVDAGATQQQPNNPQNFVYDGIQITVE